MVFELVEPTERLARIRVAGVGGAGGNAVNRMIAAGLGGVDFVAINTDLQALRLSRAAQAIQIGQNTTRGLGSGGRPAVGRESVLEDEDAIRDQLADSDMVFVTAGMGGGTGTGAAPVVARLAREAGALTVGIVTKPFVFEGSVRMEQAEAGLAELSEAVDTLIVIPNERLLEVAPKTSSMAEAFVYADNVLYEATRGIHDIIMKPHMVNLDFADVRSVMKDMGVALMGSGRATGEDRAEQAAHAAISSPLLEDVDIRGAQGVLVNLTGGDVGLMETSTVMSIIQEAAGDQAHIIFGYGVDEELGDTLQVTVIATGFDAEERRRGVPAVADMARPRVREEEPTVEDVAEAPEPETHVEPAAEEIAGGFEDARPAHRPELRVMAAAAGGEEPTDLFTAPPVDEGGFEDRGGFEDHAEPETPVADAIAGGFEDHGGFEDAAPPAAPPAAEPAPAESSATAMRFTMVESDPAPTLRPEPSAQPAATAEPDLPISDFTSEGGAPRSGAATVTEHDWTRGVQGEVGFQSDDLRRDLNEPAYTRKYMD